MRNDKLQLLGSEVYRQALRPYKGRIHQHAIIFGLDTEYYSIKLEDNRLLCWQLSLNGYKAKLFTNKLNWDVLYSESVKMLKDAGYKLKDITVMIYAVYFSTAEGQWFDLTDTNIELHSAHQANLRYKATSRRSMYMYDVSNWFPGKKLKDVAKSFGLNKYDYDVTNLTPNNLKDPLFLDYALNDAHIIGEILARLRQKEIDNSGMDILLTKTPASTAGAEFRHKYIKKPVYQNNCCLRRRALLASWGGRKESFYYGEEPLIYGYDAKHYYPSIVLKLPYLPLQKDWRSTIDLDTWLNAVGGFGDIWFKFPNTCLMPCIPVPDKNRIIFPLEGFAHCSSFEAKLAIQQGAEIHLHKGYYFNSGVNWLQEYMQGLVNIRDITEDAIIDLLTKMKANSIIGKFSQKCLDYDINDIRKLTNSTGIPTNILLNTINLPIKRKLKTGSLFQPEWYCIILGLSRAIIGKLAIECNALQIATDAVYTRNYMGTEFIFEDIRFVLEKMGDYVSYRPGLYRCGDKLKYQGASKDIASKILEHFNPLANTEYQSRRIVSIKQSYYSGKKYGSNVNMKRRVNLSFDEKRILLDTGETLPLPSIDMSKQIMREWDYYEEVNEDQDRDAGLVKDRQ